MPADRTASPIIIKRVQGGGEGGHHGGARKVAYADFVTAMMAFFLLMWLLNATTEKQRQGLADYFDPTIAHARSGGAQGMDGGRSLDPPADRSVPAAAGDAEMQELARALQDQGVETTQKTYDGVAHEFFGMGAVVPQAKEAMTQATTALTGALAAN